MTSKQFEIACYIMGSVLILLPVINWIIIKTEKKEKKNYNGTVDWLLSLDEPIELDEHEIKSYHS